MAYPQYGFGCISRTPDGRDVLGRVEGAFLAYCIIYDLFDRVVGLSQEHGSRCDTWRNQASTTLKHLFDNELRCVICRISILPVRGYVLVS